MPEPYVTHEVWLRIGIDFDYRSRRHTYCVNSCGTLAGCASVSVGDSAHGVAVSGKFALALLEARVTGSVADQLLQVMRLLRMTATDKHSMTLKTMCWS